MNTLTNYLFESIEKEKDINILKRKLIDLAIRGQLTERQNEPLNVDDLIARIKEKKEILIQDNIIKKTKSLPPIEKEEISFEIPEDWKWLRLDDISLYIQRGKSPKYSEIESSYKVISQKCVQWSGLNISRSKYLDPNFIKSYDNIRLLREGDLLWNSTGAGTIGRANIIQSISDEKLVADSHVTVIRLFKEEVDPKYILYFLMSSHIQDRVESEMASGTTKQIELNTSTVKQECVPIPPIKEQKVIVNRLDKLFSICNELEAQVKQEREASAILNKTVFTSFQSESSEEADRTIQFAIDHMDELLQTTEDVDLIKTAVLSLAMKGKLVSQYPEEEIALKLLHRIEEERNELISNKKIKKQKPLPPISENEVPFNIPNNWEWVKLGNIAQFINGDRGKNYPAKSELISEGIPFINTGNLKNGDIDPNNLGFISEERFNLLKSGKIYENDILFCLRGTLGKTALVKKIEKGAIASSLLIIRPYFSTQSRYLYFYLISNLGKNMIDKYDNGTAQPNLSANNVKNFLVPLPPLNEMNETLSKVDQLLSICEGLTKKIKNEKEASFILSKTVFK